ncbi:hypothetical protein [Leuconostoc citreum]|uniref:hypothetical protein n=1 Tax=Leuconostoc citreum TaxID=33964 RepID=UPI0032DF7E80
MSSKEFNKAVNTKPIDGLKQPDKFMQKADTKSFESYIADLSKEQENYEQAILSVAVEPTLKKLVQMAGKKVGRTKGGSKAIVREALTNYFKKHPELFE